MAENVELNIAGVWKDIDNCEVNVGGVWKQVTSIEVNVGGVWKQSWVNKVYNLDGQNISLTDAPGPILTGIHINSDGTVDQRSDNNVSDNIVQIDSATDWVIPNSISATTHYVRATQNSQTGGGTLSGTLNTWLALSTDRFWTIERAAVAGTGSSIWSLDIEIATDSGGTNVVATGTYVLTSTLPP